MEKGQRVKIVNTNSIWDDKEGVLEDIEEERCTVFVDFIPEQNKKVRQYFKLENVEPIDSFDEALKDKVSGEVGELEKDFKNGYGLLKTNKGNTIQVAIDNLEEVEDDVSSSLNVLDVITTESFEEDYFNLPNPKEADWFFEKKESNSLMILQRLGLEKTIQLGKAKKESISNNNKYKGGVTVYSLFKGAGSGNQFRAYFYREGNTCIFVRCLLKKTTKNTSEEDKAIMDTINYALSKK